VRLDDIGFYTMTDARCELASAASPLARCELVLTARCNFRCPYCRHVGGSDLPKDRALGTIAAWSLDRLQNLRLSGGEPTLWGGGPDDLVDLVGCARELGVGRVAISTNGSASIEAYAQLIDAGADDFSVSLDACCAEDGDRMVGGDKGSWEKVVENIRQLAAWTYTTVGVVLTEDNEPKCREIVQFADSLGVADIRVIPAAQRGTTLKVSSLPPEILAKHPILRYRWDNLSQGRPVRGLAPGDATRCHLVLDDMSVMGGMHYPCIIHMREGGDPIGKAGTRLVRAERAEWSRTHQVQLDPICSRNCLDVCVDYNNRYERLHLPKEGR
jgi:MoaA/NifB/PqqE/SkfB family radical SAM enzyme